MFGTSGEVFAFGKLSGVGGVLQEGQDGMDVFGTQLSGTCPE